MLVNGVKIMRVLLANRLVQWIMVIFFALASALLAQSLLPDSPSLPSAAPNMAKTNAVIQDMQQLDPMKPMEK